MLTERVREEELGKCRDFCKIEGQKRRYRMTPVFLLQANRRLVVSFTVVKTKKSRDRES